MCGHISDPSEFQAQGGIPQKTRKVKKKKKKKVEMYISVSYSNVESRERAWHHRLGISFPITTSQRSFHGDDRNSVIIHQRGGAGVDNTDVIPIKSVCL